MSVREWTPQQRALMQWLCLPGDELMGQGRGLKQHKSLSELAQHLGVDRTTLYNWQKMPGWDEALAVMAGRVFKSLKPEFVKVMSASLLQPNKPGYDRILTAWVRYVEPSINDPEEQARWNDVLPELETVTRDMTEQIAQNELRKLPIAEREVIISFMDRVRNQNSTEVLEEIPSYQIKRMVNEVEEQVISDSVYPSSTNVYNSDQSIVELALPQPQPGQPAATTSTSTSTAGAKYNPRLRKPLRRPKD